MLNHLHHPATATNLCADTSLLGWGCADVLGHPLGIAPLAGGLGLPPLVAPLSNLTYKAGRAVTAHDFHELF